MLERILQLKFIILFFILAQLIIMSVISINEANDKKLFLKSKTQLAQIEYETIYWKIKEQSTMIFQELINNKKIIDLYKNAYVANDETKAVIREKLYKTLEPSYERLNKLINLRQLHFHLPDNRSFLRMHRPKKFGDDLSDVRKTVAYTNANKKPIDGFEEGRVYNGFRFVYPLFDEEKNYIGSVEVSFSVSSFQNTLSDDIRFSQFIFSKKIVSRTVWEDEYVKNYTQSKISPLFLLESTWINDKFAPFKREIQKNITAEVQATFLYKLTSAAAYSLALDIGNETAILTFLPIKNPVTGELSAYLVMISKGLFLNHLHLDNILINLVSFALLLTLFILIYRHYRYQDEIQEQHILLMEHSKMAQMGSMLSNIAHQWKQPLARINSKLIEIPLTLSLSEKDEKSLDKNLEQIENFTSYMANTIENFKTYFHPNKKKEYFNLNQIIEKAIILLDLNSTIESNIKLIQAPTTNIQILCYEDELIQVLMVLLLNAKEALEEQNISKPYIKIDLKDSLEIVKITIIDNAGGIDDKILKSIFNPYFSTKSSNSNSGIGLYMAKMLIENSMSGKLRYTRDKKLSLFSITLKGIKNG